MAIQWHPLFAQLLRPWLEGFYEVQTNVPVGDVPRQADIVLLRRMGDQALPFTGLWRCLTRWSILEYKGPTVSARLDALDLLIELGLGIHRRLNEEDGKRGRAQTVTADVSFWYLVNHLGRRFLSAARTRLGILDEVEPGVWASSVLGRTVFLISSRDLSVEPDCIPLHVLGVENGEKELAAARLILQRPDLWELYTQFMASLHPDTIKELRDMARASQRGPKFQLRPLADWVGLGELINQFGQKELIENLLADQKSRKKVIAELLESLSEAEREQFKRQLK